MDTRVLTAIPQSIETVHWFAPSTARRSLIMCPIPFKAIIPIYCDSPCKSTTFFSFSKIKSQYVAIFASKAIHKARDSPYIWFIATTITLMVFFYYNYQLFFYFTLKLAEIAILPCICNWNTYTYYLASISEQLSW